MTTYDLYKPAQEAEGPRYRVPRVWPLYGAREPEQWESSDPDPGCAHDWVRTSTTEWQCPHCLTIRRLRAR